MNSYVSFWTVQALESGVSDGEIQKNEKAKIMKKTVSWETYFRKPRSIKWVILKIKNCQVRYTAGEIRGCFS